MTYFNGRTFRYEVIALWNMLEKFLWYVGRTLALNTWNICTLSTQFCVDPFAAVSWHVWPNQMVQHMWTARDITNIKKHKEASHFMDFGYRKYLWADLVRLSWFIKQRFFFQLHSLHLNKMGHSSKCGVTYNVELLQMSLFNGTISHVLRH
jgi:hypothetical protein